MKYKEYIGIGALLFLFVLSAYLANRYAGQLQLLIEGYEYLGMFFYVLLATTSTVLAPLNTVFLLPVAVALWGSFVTATLSVLGWTLGAVIAYYLARTFGKPLVSKVSDMKKFEKIQRAIPERNIFIWIIFARIAVPVDALSYALGLFLPMSYAKYTLATLIGVTPFAFIFSYASNASTIVMVLAGIFTLLMVLFGVFWYKKASQSVKE